MRRKPDIKYTKREEDFDRLHEIQLELLDNAEKLLKPGGRLVYSTCTVSKKENEGTVEAFLASHPEMKLVPINHLPKQLLEAQHEGIFASFSTRLWK